MVPNNVRNYLKNVTRKKQNSKLWMNIVTAWLCAMFMSIVLCVLSNYVALGAIIFVAIVTLAVSLVFREKQVLHCIYNIFLFTTLILGFLSFILTQLKASALFIILIVLILLTIFVASCLILNKRIRDNYFEKQVKNTPKALLAFSFASGAIGACIGRLLFSNMKQELIPYVLLVIVMPLATLLTAVIAGEVFAMYFLIKYPMYLDSLMEDI